MGKEVMGRMRGREEAVRRGRGEGSDGAGEGEEECWEREERRGRQRENGERGEGGSGGGGEDRSDGGGGELGRPADQEKPGLIWPSLGLQLEFLFQLNHSSPFCFFQQL